ncbi:MAG: hypothetical protein E6I84_03990 [Chloroflexi bacterium]|nr:MAG: hypothetical protein E6I84_03990 [Chloroflexota bacterium]
MEPQDNTLFAADLFLVVGVDHQGQHGAVDAGGGLDDVRDVAHTGEVVEIGHVSARGLLVSCQVVVATSRDAFQL